MKNSNPHIIIRLRTEWIKSCQQTEEKRREWFNELTKTCGLASRKQIKLEKELRDSLEVENKNLEAYHKCFNSFIAYGLNTLTSTLKKSAEDEIERIKSGDDWIYVFDVLKKYGVQI